MQMCAISAETSCWSNISFILGNEMHIENATEVIESFHG